MSSDKVIPAADQAAQDGVQAGPEVQPEIIEVPNNVRIFYQNF